MSPHLFAAVVAGGVSVASVEPTLDEALSQSVGVASLAAVVVFLFKWGNGQRKQAREEAQELIDEMRADRDEWKNRYLATEGNTE